MGNAEIKALTAESPIFAAEIHRAHQQFKIYGRDFSLDKSAFGLLFDTSLVSFQLIDQLFEALDIDGSGTIDFAELAIGLVSCCSQLSPKEKLNLMFDAIDIDGDEELTMDEVQQTLSRFLVGVVSRMRGVEKSQGRVAYVDRRCSSCHEVPINLVYECLDCCKGMALGVPITVHLCKNCAPVWEGYGLGSHDMLHTKQHKLVKACQASNPHVVTHPGVACTVCEAFPITGTRYRCKQCRDFVNLCESCYQEGEEPRSHRLHHDMEVLRTASSLKEEVQRLIADLFESTDADSDGLITREEFHRWGAESEVASCLLRGFQVQFVKYCPYLEQCTFSEQTATNVAGR